MAVTPPTPPADAATRCAALAAALPAELGVGPRRDVAPESPLTAAYGDPAVSIRCGVPAPSALRATSDLVTVDGIDWFPEQLTAGWMMTTIGLPANVEVVVPDSQGPAPSVAADLGPTLSRTLATG